MFTCGVAECRDWLLDVEDRVGLLFSTISSLIAKAEGKLVSASCTDLVAIQSVWNILRVWPGDWQSVPGASVCVCARIDLMNYFVFVL